ncbi:hypothetical protein PAXRUDRAFT_822641 [Paxillus rubicundulus Ve08.2h10]|uniref:Ricin B lectin domain-containing protein n=1 Tax=Paxillus rubicundulus Ve08.2h10 TaxID=930991 RepID=A0A0D0E9M7_9AGAM|nr:hypothetical protein PAXRUDRAFT_822641 [Paxillus rubicundulus Ve08.2h10]
MSGPQPGVYTIVSNEHNIPIGAADYDPDVEERLVISLDPEGAQDWVVEDEGPGKYRLTVPSANFTYENENQNVVVRDQRRGLIWKVVKYGDEEYTIERDSDIRPNAGWTLTSSTPNSPVKLQIIGDFPTRNQLWRFIPYPGVSK